MALLTLLILSSLLFIFLKDTLACKITPNPTNTKVRRVLRAYLPRHFEGPIYELGSGFGHMTLFFSRLYPNAPIESFEMASSPYWVQKIWLLFKGNSRIRLNGEDFFQKDLAEAKLVFCYLYRGAMPKLKEKYQREMKRGSWLISHTFAIEGLTPKHIAYAKDLYQTPIYFYQK